MPEFLAYDGEAVRDRYVLLANNREHVYNAHGLSTRECLEFLTRDYSHKTRWVRVLYGMDFDVNHWLRDLADRLLLDVTAGRPVLWQGFVLEYLPRKLFTIRAPNGRKFTYFDAWGFFLRPFTATCNVWLGQVPPLLSRGKSERAVFHRWPLQEVIAYNALECALLVAIMDRLRSELGSLADPISLRTWYGPGAIANRALRASAARREMWAL